MCGWTRDVGGQGEAGDEQEAGEEVRGAGQVDGDARGDGDGEDLGEEEGADHAADGADTVDGALELALRSRVDPTRHQRLHGRAGNTPEAEKRNGAEEHPAARGECKAQEAEHAEGQAGENSGPVSVLRASLRVMNPMCGASVRRLVSSGSGAANMWQ